VIAIANTPSLSARGPADVAVVRGVGFLTAADVVPNRAAVHDERA